MKKPIYCVFGIFLLIGALLCEMSGAQTPATSGTGTSNVAASSAPSQDKAQPKAQTDTSFIIGNEDLLAISVWKEPDLTKQIPVRSDGMISMPLIGEVQAAGKTPAQLQQDITSKLRSFITDPQVSVIVQEIRSLKFNILGQVAKPGSYSLTSGMTIVDAIAVAGGFRDFAKKKGINIFRPNPAGADTKLSFNYQDFIKGKNTERNITLKPRDTIVVP